MLTSLNIEGYRSFRSFKVEDLNQVNLIVGTNNCGKTTILEAANILLDVSNQDSIYESSLRRGEVNLNANQIGRRGVDISHLFYGHNCHIGNVINISAGQTNGMLSCDIKIIDKPRPKSASLFDEGNENLTDEPFCVLSVGHTASNDEINTSLSLSETIVLDNIVNSVPSLKSRSSAASKEPPVIFITSESLNRSDMSEIWDAIALTSDEHKIIDVLKILEPDVERIAFLSRSKSSQGGIVLKVRGHDDRIPLGSFGDGMRRLMALAMGMIRSSGGSVMIDEIDTGLHYTAMQDMWRMVIQTAETLNVQVFATTHSKDCIEALGALHNIDSKLCEPVRVHRIEKGTDKAITFHPEELATMVKMHGEIR